MKKLVLFGMLAMLSACGGDRKGSEDAVRGILKDPESVQFGNFSYNKSTKRGCLGFNAKNSMGGYTGEHQAYVMKTEGGWMVDRTAEISASLCRDVLDIKE